MNIQIEDKNKELHLIARGVIKDSICEYLEVDDKIESMLNIEVQAFNGVYIKVLGYDIFSLIRDVDCYDTYHAKIKSPIFYIKEDTSEKDIERYNKRMKFLNLISSKEAFLKLKEISLNNLLTLNEEIESIIENQHVCVPTGTQTCLKGGVTLRIRKAKMTKELTKKEIKRQMKALEILEVEATLCYSVH